MRFAFIKPRPTGYPLLFLLLGLPLVERERRDRRLASRRELRVERREVVAHDAVVAGADVLVLRLQHVGVRGLRFRRTSVESVDAGVERAHALAQLHLAGEASL